MSNESERKALFEDLKNAIKEDKLYWIRNDAKIRASTTCQTYDEFKDKVAAAHLSPLDRRELTKKPPSTWNRSATPKRTE